MTFWQLCTLNVISLIAITPLAFSKFVPVDGPISSDVWLLVGLSAFFNIIVITFHIIKPPHPKFLMLPRRKFWIRVHVIGGTGEFALGVAALWLTSMPEVSVAMALVALCFHIPSSIAQAPIVSGSKAIMLPAYYLVIITHIACATKLLFNPSSTLWAVNTFLIFNIYVWVRVYFYIFEKLQICQEAPYSMGILAAGMTTGTAAFGAIWPLIAAVYVVVFAVVYRTLIAEDEGDYLTFTRERARESAIDRDVQELFGDNISEQENEEYARELFEHLDTDNDGSIQRRELKELLLTWALPEHIIPDLLDHNFDDENGMDFEVFKKRVWTIGSIRSRSAVSIGAHHAVSERDKAQFVFDYVDMRQTGYIERFELELLLLEWGLPIEEATEYMDLYDTDKDGRLTFDEFYTAMRPLWRFIYYTCLQHRGLQGRGSEQPATVRADKHRTAAMRRVLTRQLVGRVRFLAGAEPELINNLASSLVPECFENGQSIFEAGEPAHKFYLVGQGAVEVWRSGVHAADIEEGGCFGEGALISPHPRNATVHAQGKTLLYSLTRSSFEFITREHPRVCARLQALHAERQTQNITRTLTDQIMDGVHILKGATPEIIEALAGTLEEEHYDSGDTILEQDDPGDCCYIVAKGQLDITRNGESLVRIGQGGCIGEGALLSASPRQATARALESSILYKLNRSSFQEIVHRSPEVLKKVESLHALRMAQNRSPNPNRDN